MSNFSSTCQLIEKMKYKLSTLKGINPILSLTLDKKRRRDKLFFYQQKKSNKLL